MYTRLPSDLTLVSFFGFNRASNKRSKNFFNCISIDLSSSHHLSHHHEHPAH